MYLDINFKFVLSLHYLEGSNDCGPLDYVEQYDPKQDSWSIISQTLSPRGGVGVATLRGKLYAVGGYNGAKCLDTVEAYDPNTNRLIFIVDIIVINSKTSKK